LAARLPMRCMGSTLRRRRNNACSLRSFRADENVFERQRLQIEERRAAEAVRSGGDGRKAFNVEEREGRRQAKSTALERWRRARSRGLSAEEAARAVGVARARPVPAPSERLRAREGFTGPSSRPCWSDPSQEPDAWQLVGRAKRRSSRGGCNEDRRLSGIWRALLAYNDGSGGSRHGRGRAHDRCPVTARARAAP
jgi:hypothetical protein